jgi:hypothetical protein
VRICHLPLAVLLALLALACPALAQVAIVFYSASGGEGIESVSGTIVEKTERHLKVETEDGRIISIPQKNVYHIIGNSPAALDKSDPDLLNSLSTRGRRSRETGSTHHLGIKGGMNIANMSVDPQDLEEENSLRSYAIGAWYGVPLNRRLTIQTEAIYSVKGDSESGDGYTATTRMGYIDVPVLAKIGFLHGSPARPSLFLGPSVGVNVSANSKFEGGGSDMDLDVKEDVRTFDFGLVIGGGVDFAVGEHTYGVDLRYSRGLTNVAGEGANGDARNHVFAVMGSMRLQ